MSQPYLQSQHHLESQLAPGLAASLSPMQVSYNTMQLHPSTSSQSSHTARISSTQYCTQYDIDAHQSSKSEQPDILQIILGRLLRSGSAHIRRRCWPHKDSSLHLTHQIPLQNSRISRMTISMNLPSPPYTYKHCQRHTAACTQTAPDICIQRYQLLRHGEIPR
jgi:hypothetical protein